MSFFGVVFESNPQSPATLEVLDFHCAIAEIGCFFLHGNYCDIGLRLRAAEGKISKFKVVLPFQIDDHKNVCRDLEAKLHASTTLIFGRYLVGGTLNVGTDQFKTIDYIDLISQEEIDRRMEGGKPIPTEHVIPIGKLKFTQATKDKQNPSLSELDGGGSLYEVEFDPPIEKNDDPKKSEVYLRMRFRVSNMLHTRVSRRSLLVRSGVILDFRFYDEREALSGNAISGLRNKLVPAKRLNVFLLFPWYYQLINTSPDLQYSRLLEGEAWKPYLGTTGWSLFGERSEKIVIYQWRSYGKTDNKQISPVRSVPITLSVQPPNITVQPNTISVDLVPAPVKPAPVSPARPFRVFADFSPEAGGIRKIGVVVMASVTAVLTVLLITHHNDLWDHAKALWDLLIKYFVSILLSVGVGGIVGFIIKLILQAIQAPAFLRRMRSKWQNWQDKKLGR